MFEIQTKLHQIPTTIVQYLNAKSNQDSDPHWEIVSLSWPVTSPTENCITLPLSSEETNLITLCTKSVKLYHSASENCQIILERTRKASLFCYLQKLCQAAHQVPLFWDSSKSSPSVWGYQQIRSLCFGIQIKNHIPLFWESRKLNHRVSGCLH